MGFRLLVDKRKGAALNLLSETLNSFDTESAGRAAVLASFASVAVNAIAHGEDAASLRRGLLSNREIGKAVGMLMLLNGFTEEEAFDLLRHHSQSLNIKLADVARTVIENRGQLPPPPPNPPQPTNRPTPPPPARGTFWAALPQTPKSKPPNFPPPALKNRGPLPPPPRSPRNRRHGQPHRQRLGELFGQPQLGLLHLFDVDVLEGDHPHLLDEPSRPVHVPYPGIGQS